MKITKPRSLKSRYRVLGMVTADYSETSVLIYQRTNHHVAEESIFFIRGCNETVQVQWRSWRSVVQGDYSPLMERVPLRCKLKESGCIRIQTQDS